MTPPTEKKKKKKKLGSWLEIVESVRLGVGKVLFIYSHK